MRTRVYRAGLTYFIVLTGQSCGTSFFDRACYRFYLKRFSNSLCNFHVRLHAYSLLANEILLLATPLTPSAMSRLISSVNRAYSDYYNDRFGRAVSVFGAPPTRIVAKNELALEVQKYIERAALHNTGIEHPGAYEWSSYCANSFGCKSSFLTPHGAYQKFLRAHSHPYQSYREFVARPFDSAYEDFLRSRFCTVSAGLPEHQFQDRLLVRDG